MTGRRFTAGLALNLCLFAQTGAIHFQERAASAGIDFILENHPTERKHMMS